MHERMIAAMILALSCLVGPAALAGKEALAALGAVARRKIAETIGLTADVIVVFAKTIERSIGKAKRVLDQRSHA
jgi:phenylacetate-coenzyme A ligase PaaK-like adenylate-forming protein